MNDAHVPAPPAIEPIIAEAEQRITQSLVDPESARFEWPYELAYNKKAGTFWTCGRYNARNRMGGYAGFEWFSVAYRDGQVVNLQTGEGSPWIPGQCFNAAKKGELKARS